MGRGPFTKPWSPGFTPRPEQMLLGSPVLPAEKHGTIHLANTPGPMCSCASDCTGLDALRPPVWPSPEVGSRAHQGTKSRTNQQGWPEAGLGRHRQLQPHCSASAPHLLSSSCPVPLSIFKSSSKGPGGAPPCSLQKSRDQSQQSCRKPPSGPPGQLGRQRGLGRHPEDHGRLQAPPPPQNPGT